MWLFERVILMVYVTVFMLLSCKFENFIHKMFYLTNKICQHDFNALCLYYWNCYSFNICGLASFHCLCLTVIQIFAFLTEKEEKAKIIIYIFVCVWQLHASVIQVLLTELKLYWIWNIYLKLEIIQSVLMCLIIINCV